MASRPIKIAIIGDDSQLKKTLKGATKKLEGFGKGVAKFGIAAGAAFGATAAAAATKGITAFADFEKGMKEVMTLMPNAGDEVFGQMSEQVKSLSKEMGILPDEITGALYQAISAGIPRENVFEFLRTSSEAAKGGISDLETSVDGISSVLAAYSETGMTATEASDLLFTAVKKGKTDFGQLSKEVFKVAPIAASVGIEFGAVTAALSELTLKGTPTAQAASMLKVAFSELAKQGTKASNSFEELSGQTLTDFLAGGGKFEEALVMMKDGADKAGISVMDMFGSVEAGQAILTLTADGGTALTETMAEMNNSAGATKTAFETMDTGMSASFDKIKANLSVMAIDVGEKLAPHVAKATEFILEGFQKLAPHVAKAKEVVKEFVTEFIERATPAFEKFVEVFKKVIGWIRTFIEENPHAALAALGVLVASIVVPAVLGLVAAFAALFSPVLLIIGAIAALAAGLVYAYKHVAIFHAFVNAVAEFFVKDFVPIVKKVIEVLVIGWKAFADFFVEYVFPIVRGAFNAIISVLENFWDVIYGVYELVAALFSGDFKEVWIKLRSLVGEIMQFILDLFIALPSRILWASRNLIVVFLEIVAMFSKWLSDKIFDLVTALPKKIYEFLSGIASDILNLGKDLGNWIIDGLVSAIKAAAGAVMSAVQSIIPNVSDIAGGIASSVGGFFKSVIPGLAEGGIVTKPTLAVIGEAGAEAVIPLNKAGSLGGTSINLTVNAGMGTDGAEVGQQIVTALQSWSRQNGSIPITTVSQ